jgi:formylglycine-generating enzyme required for sulfatase activity
MRIRTWVVACLLLTAAFSVHAETPSASSGPNDSGHQVGGTFRDCSDCPEMVWIPSGHFQMGSPNGHGYSDEYPQHLVNVSAFALGKYDVTFNEWDACVADGGCTKHPSDHGWGRGRRPVINVSWNDAQQYAAWLTKNTGKQYRLPTEAEWEYAARAGTTTAYYWGDQVGSGHANCGGCGSQWDKKTTAPVGSFRPNRWGLYDMAGNVVQWTEDCYHSSYEGAPTDGKVWDSAECAHRVVRGGSLSPRPLWLRSADRGRRGYADFIVGFRVARTS